MHRRSRTVDAAVSLYRIALTRSPASFSDYREEAVRDFERIATRARRRSGRGAVAVALVRALLDVAARAPAEWRKNRTGGRTMTRTWKEELTNAARTLVRRPLFTTVALVTLALGIGATVAIFTVVDAVLIRPLPYPDADRIVSIGHHAPGLDLPELRNSGGMARFYLSSAPFLRDLALLDQGHRNLTGLDRPEQVEVARVSPSLFDVLETGAARGRTLGPDDARPGAPAVAVVSHDAWVRIFGEDPGLVGRTLEIDDIAHEVVGVMPPGFAFPGRETVAWIPHVLTEDAPFGTFGMGAIARLPEGMSLEAARREIEALQARVPDFFDSITADFLERAQWSVSLTSLKEEVVGDVRTGLWVVLGTVAFVLLIACANVANLFLVRAELRQRELAVRAALGAGRGRLAIAYLSESLVVGVAAGAVALAGAWFGVQALVAAGPEGLPRLHEVGVGGRTVAFTLLVSVLASLALGALPAVRYLGRSFAGVLRAGGRGATDGRERHRTRNLLVAGQLALALVLLVGSGLMLRSFHELRSVDHGLEPEGVLTVGLSVGEGWEREEAARFYQRVVEEAEGLAAVEAVGATNAIPVLATGANGGSFTIESRPRAEDELPPVAMNVVVAGDFFEALGIPVLRGRGVLPSDHTGERPVLWVNEAFVRSFLEGADPLAERVGFQTDGPFAEIVGVVGDTHHFGLDQDIRPIIYLPMRSGAAFDGRTQVASMGLVVKTGLDDPTSLTPAVRDIVQRLDPRVPVTRTATMERVVAESMAEASFTLVLLGVAAGMALILGAVGIYGVIAYVVSRRTREIGVRIALGADQGAVRWMVVRQGMAVAAVGIAVGIGVGLAVTPLMGSLLFGVSPTDPTTFAAVAVLLAGVAAVASYLPARRASRVHPVEALVSE